MLLDKEYCKQWYLSHVELHNYDFFVSFYEPLSILLFEESRKPLIMMIPVRAFFPLEGIISKCCEALARLKSRSIPFIIVANNKYDQAYFNFFSHLKCEYIPSLCDYLEAVWSGEREDWLLDFRFVPDFELDKATKKFGNYAYADLFAYRGYIEVDPRQVSTMSFFERYAIGMPMIYPSLKLLQGMWEKRHALYELHFCGKKEMEMEDYPDIPLELADFYTFPHVQLFDDLESLQQLIWSTDCKKVSEDMKKSFSDIRVRTLKQWEVVVGRLTA
jgi:hypothetical protein